MLEVFTIGGGETLVNVFNSSAAWAGGGGFKSLIKVVMVMGLIHSLIMMAFNLDYKASLRWFLSSTLIYSCVMVPTVSIKVTDRLNPSLAPSTISNVPLGLGVMASFSSQVSDFFTRTAETVFVMPTAMAYSQNGMVYGSKLLDKTRTISLRDPAMNANLNEYIKMCVFYDVMLGQKSAKTMMESSNLWAELGPGAVNRAVKWVPEVGMPEYKTCNQAYSDLDVFWQQRFYNEDVPKFAMGLFPDMGPAAARTKLEGDLSQALGFYAGSSQSPATVFRQIALADAFALAQSNFGNDEADAFAVKRAETQARNTQSSVATQAMTWVPVLQIVLTSVFYAMFIVIAPLFLFPGTGVQTMKGYLAGFFYLASWGPLYVVLHMFLTDRGAAAVTAAAKISAANGAGAITIANMNTVFGVNDETASLAGYLLMSVPVLAASLARGAMSASSSVGSMLQAATSGADASAVERTTGNYSYGNTSFANLNANNRQMNHWDTAPSFATGAPLVSYRDSQGVISKNFGDGVPVYDSSGGMSNLPFKPTWSSSQRFSMLAAADRQEMEAKRIEDGTSSVWSTMHARIHGRSTADTDRRAHAISRGTDERSGWQASQGRNWDQREGFTSDQVTDKFNNSSKTNSEREIDERYRSGEGIFSYGVNAKIGFEGGGKGGSVKPSPLSGSVGATVSKDHRWVSGGRVSNLASEEDTSSYGENNSDRRTDGFSQNTSKYDNAGLNQSGGSFKSVTDTSETAITHTVSTSEESREQEMAERRQAASHLRENARKLREEASYSASNDQGVSYDMSNMIQARYEEMSRDNQHLSMPSFSSPKLSAPDAARRDFFVRQIQDDLLQEMGLGINAGISAANDAGLNPSGNLIDVAYGGAPDKRSETFPTPRSELEKYQPETPIAGGSRSLPPPNGGRFDGNKVAAELGMEVKPTARISKLDGSMLPVMFAVAQAAKEMGIDPRAITSGNDSIHKNGSRHYTNEALDFRGKDIEVWQGKELARRVNSKLANLGTAYFVDFEVDKDDPDNNHLHVQKRR